MEEGSGGRGVKEEGRREGVEEDREEWRRIGRSGAVEWIRGGSGGAERGKEEEGEEWRGKRGEERSMRLKKIMFLPAHRHINSMLKFFQAQIHTHTCTLYTQ